MRRFLAQTLVIAVTAVVACDGVDDPATCPEAAISPSLARVFYWGASDPDNWSPNTGNVVGSGAFLQWRSAESVLMSTEAVVGGERTRGIGEMLLDQGGGFLSIDIHRFENEIWDLRVGSQPDDILILYFATPSSQYPTLARVRLESGNAVIESVILDEAWNTRGVAPLSDGSLIVCATKPGDPYRGLYRITDDGGVPADSLIRECVVADNAARAMDAAADGMLYYVIYRVPPAPTLVVRLDITVPDAFPRVIAERPGRVDRIAVDPADPTRILVQRTVSKASANGFEGVIELLDAGSGDVVRTLDVRTSTASCRLVQSHFPDWKLDGSSFLFPSWSSDGASEFPSSIWRRDM